VGGKKGANGMARKSEEGNDEASANSTQLDTADAAVLPSATGREDNLGADPGLISQPDISRPVGAQPASAITGTHQPGTGANETPDGLSGSEEALRRAAEGETRPRKLEDLPVFDRAEADPDI